MKLHNKLEIKTKDKTYTSFNNLIFPFAESLLEGGAYSKYLAYLFMTDYWRSQLREVVNGVKVYSITQQILKNTKIIVPPLDTINDITNYLDIECKKIDELIQNKQLQIEKLEIYKQSLIYEYVTGKKRVKGE